MYGFTTKIWQDIKATISKDCTDLSGKTQYVIYIWTESMGKLRQLVLPFFVPSMTYKLGNCQSIGGAPPQ